MSSIASARLGYDAALAGAECYVIGLGARPRTLPVRRWRGEPTDADHRLLDLCQGPTLDVGCGPGRLAAELLRRGQPALGIDVSAVAVAMARRRGVPALVRDVFAPLPQPGTWTSVLLADGNIGIGGDPDRLLDRACQLLCRGGAVVVELAARGIPTRRHHLCLLVHERRTQPFSWAVVGVDEIAAMVGAAGLALEHVEQVDGRWFARLCRRVGRTR